MKKILLLCCLSYVLSAQDYKSHFIRLSDIIEEVGFEVRDCPLCNGTAEVDVYSGYCERCKSWSIEYRKENTCPGCGNIGEHIGRRKCTWSECHSGFIVDEDGIRDNLKHYLTNNYTKNDIVFMIKYHYINHLDISKKLSEDKEYQKSLIKTHEENHLTSFYKELESSNGPYHDRIVSRKKLSYNFWSFNDDMIHWDVDDSPANSLSYSELSMLIGKVYPGYRFSNLEEINNVLNREELRLKLLVINQANGEMEYWSYAWPIINTREYIKGSNNLVYSTHRRPGGGWGSNRYPSREVISYYPFFDVYGSDDYFLLITDRPMPNMSHDIEKSSDDYNEDNSENNYAEDISGINDQVTLQASGNKPTVNSEIDRSDEFWSFSQRDISTISSTDNDYWGIAVRTSNRNKNIYALVRKVNNKTEVKLDNLDDSFGLFGIYNGHISVKHGLKNSQDESISRISLVKDSNGIVHFIDRFGVVQPFKGEIEILGNYTHDLETYVPFDPLCIYKLNGDIYFNSAGLKDESNELESFRAIMRYNSITSKIPKFLATNHQGGTFLIALDENKHWKKIPFNESYFEIHTIDGKLGIKALNSTSWIVQPNYDIIDVYKNTFFCKNSADYGYSVYSINGSQIIDGVVGYYNESPFNNCSMEIDGIFIEIGKHKYRNKEGKNATTYGKYYGIISGDKCIIEPNLNYINILPNGFIIGMKDWGDYKESFIWDETGNRLYFSDKNYLAYYCLENTYELKDFNQIDSKTNNYKVLKKSADLNDVLGFNLENLKSNMEVTRIRDFYSNELRNEENEERLNKYNLYLESESCVLEVYNRWGSKETSIPGLGLDIDSTSQWIDLLKKSNWDPQDGIYYYSLLCSGVKKSGTIVKNEDAYTFE